LELSYLRLAELASARFSSQLLQSGDCHGIVGGDAIDGLEERSQRGREITREKTQIRHGRIACDRRRPYGSVSVVLNRESHWRATARSYHVETRSTITLQRAKSNGSFASSVAFFASHCIGQDSHLNHGLSGFNHSIVLCSGAFQCLSHKSPSNHSIANPLSDIENCFCGRSHCDRQATSLDGPLQLSEGCHRTRADA
jgi:hypothetical protein